MRAVPQCSCLPGSLVANWLVNSWTPFPFLSVGLPLSCGCGAAEGFHLNGPVQVIHAVTLDGMVLDPLVDYRVYGRQLIRMADPVNQGRRAWPCCQRLDLTDDQPGTWTIDYTWGKAVPWAGKIAVIAYACHLAKLVKAGKCGVPERASRIDRQGVSFTMVDPKELLRGGRTGVRATDAWL